MVGHLPARSRPLYSRPVSRPQASLLLAPRTTEPALEGRSSEHARAIRRVQEEPRRPAKDIKRRGLSERRPAVVALVRTSASGPSFILSSHSQWCCRPIWWPIAKPIPAHSRNFWDLCFIKVQRGPLLCRRKKSRHQMPTWSPAAKALVAAARALAGTFVRWESSGEGSNCRCTSLASKAPIAAALTISDSDSDFEVRFALNRSAWSALIVVLDRITPATARAQWRCAKHLGIRQKTRRVPV